jgi:hypothetical protein
VTFSQRLKIALKATRQLGFKQVGLYTYYQFGVRSGLFRQMTPAQKPKESEILHAYQIANDLVHIPNRDELTKVIGEDAFALLSEADDLGKSKVRLFGGPPQSLNFIIPLPLEHWTSYLLDSDKLGTDDIKFIWEPARFTWIYTLARAFHLSKDEIYAETFWREFEAFTDINITNLGPNWISGQEVAFRLIAFTFAYQVFSSSGTSTPDRIERLSLAIADHATRIPATLIYARAQNNNHLISEAAGLITAAYCLPEHPKSRKWRELGRHWFNHALQTQIADDGTYVQHSTNYHRLMLQIALWVYTLEGSFPKETHQKLAAATSWLLELVDPGTGRVPNLGHNDGAYLQPLTSCSFHDYRPVLQAAAVTFLEEQPFPAGPWNELSLWLGLSKHAQFEHDQVQSQVRIDTYPDSHTVVRNYANHSWASCRVTRYQSRPAHADQLHLDLWWKGLNVAQDAGTFSYNAPSPWENSLVHTAIHNTVTINDRDQMTHAGRFLWLDWAQAQITHHETDPEAAYGQLVAQHDGYHKLGVIHQRSVSTHSTGSWIIEDHLFPSQKKHLIAKQSTRQVQDQSGEHLHYRARLHWLLPDWSWELNEDDRELQTIIRLRSPQGWIVLNIGIESATHAQDENKPPLVQLARAGESLIGYGPISPNSGWVSPTYGYKIPALSLAITVETPLPLKFKSLWEFPQDK